MLELLILSDALRTYGLSALYRFLHIRKIDHDQ